MCLIEPLSNSRGAAHLRYSLELVLVWCRAWGRRGAAPPVEASSHSMLYNGVCSLVYVDAEEPTRVQHRERRDYLQVCYSNRAPKFLNSIVGVEGGHPRKWR